MKNRISLIVLSVSIIGTPAAYSCPAGDIAKCLNNKSISKTDLNGQIAQEIAALKDYFETRFTTLEGELVSDQRRKQFAREIADSSERLNACASLKHNSKESIAMIATAKSFEAHIQKRLQQKPGTQKKLEVSSAK